ncbi:MAG: AI-2E family transporter [Pseudomonadota bacterium]
MALPVRQQIIYWSIAAAVFLALLWYLGDVVLPFIIGGALAYFFDPVADRLERMGLSRLWAAIVICLAAILILVLVSVVVFPLLISQTVELVRQAPEIFQSIQSYLNQRFPDAMAEGSPLRQSIASIGDSIQARGDELLSRVLNSALGVVNVLVFMIVVPVVFFYLLKDWDRMVAEIDTLLPRDHAPVIRDLAGQIDQTLASFVRGQGTVCLILGTFYAIALMLMGLNFGILVGFIAGLLTFIPYLGALIGGALAVGLALFQFWGDWLWIVAIYAVFQFGQFVEGNILTPNLVGSSVGLHPVWLIFALSAFGAVFGLVGFLVAVPVAAMIGVLIRYAIARYREGLLYRGVEGASEDADEA